MAIRLAIALSLLLAACEQASLDDGFDTVDQEGKEDGVQRPVGTFAATGVAPGQFSLLVLESDRTFYREMVVACFTTPCPPIAQQGRYVFTSSGHIRYIRFQDSTGAVIDKFAYVLDGDSLELRKTYTDVWFQMERRHPAWCTSAGDCAMQQLSPSECDGEWLCTDGACEYQCEPSAADCETEGGSCVALTPDACADGILADPSRLSCGPGLGIGCCMPRELCPPSCEGGGWTDGCSGESICAAACEGATAECGAIGSRSEGWYATVEGAGCIGQYLIRWDRCAAVEPVGCDSVEPGNGGEGEPCASTEDCDGQQYCNPTRCVCYPPRECAEDVDCDDPTNGWTHDPCSGSATCVGGLCEWACD